AVQRGGERPGQNEEEAQPQVAVRRQQRPSGEQAREEEEVGRGLAADFPAARLGTEPPGLCRGPGGAPAAARAFTRGTLERRAADRTGTTRPRARIHRSSRVRGRSPG